MEEFTNELTPQGLERNFEIKATRFAKGNFIFPPKLEIRGKEIFFAKKQHPQRCCFLYPCSLTESLFFNDQSFSTYSLKKIRSSWVSSVRTVSSLPSCTALRKTSFLIKAPLMRPRTSEWILRWSSTGISIRTAA